MNYSRLQIYNFREMNIFSAVIGYFQFLLGESLQTVNHLLLDFIFWTNLRMFLILKLRADHHHCSRLRRGR